MRGSGYLFLIVMSLRGLESMHGLRDPSFLATKKKPAADGKGRMSPAFSMYSVIAALSGPEIEYSWPLGIVESGIRSMAQSGLCRGSDMALDLLKTSLRWW